MRELIVTDEVLRSAALPDAAFYGMLIQELIGIADDEVTRGDEMDLALIEDCTEAAAFLQRLSDGKAAFCEVGEMNLDKKIIRICDRSRRGKKIAAGLCACLVLAVCAGAFSVREGFVSSDSGLAKALGVFGIVARDGKNKPPRDAGTATAGVLPDGTTAKAPETTNAASVTMAKASETIINNTNSGTEAPTEAGVISLTLQYPSGFQTEYTAVKDISLSGVTAVVKMSDGTKKTVPIEKCGVRIGSPGKNGRTKITVSYSGQSFTFYVTVRSQEERKPQTLVSIYGAFGEKYTVDDMTVYGVYSDGSKKEIPLSSCEVKKYYSEELGGNIVEVSYGGCSFTFAPEE